MPGRFIANKNNYGHLRLRTVIAFTFQLINQIEFVTFQILSQNLNLNENESDSILVSQFSSIGSLGANEENWLFTEFYESLNTTAIPKAVSSSVKASKSSKAKQSSKENPNMIFVSKYIQITHFFFNFFTSLKLRFIRVLRMFGRVLKAIQPVALSHTRKMLPLNKSISISIFSRYPKKKPNTHSDLSISK